MAAKRLFVLLITLLVTGCAVNRTAEITRIALLAPFEGRYREVGYDLLYAARLALREGGYTGIEILPANLGLSQRVSLYSYGLLFIVMIDPFL